ncbi:hypothetical protein A2U01_0049668, partial [Trifolium medium]|nr:hypothetical protein [Trifolium medium]
AAAAAADLDFDYGYDQSQHEVNDEVENHHHQRFGDCLEKDHEYHQDN